MGEEEGKKGLQWDWATAVAVPGGNGGEGEARWQRGLSAVGCIHPRVAGERLRMPLVCQSLLYSTLELRTSLLHTQKLRVNIQHGNTKLWRFLGTCLTVSPALKKQLNSKHLQSHSKQPSSRLKQYSTQEKTT